ERHGRRPAVGVDLVGRRRDGDTVGRDREGMVHVEQQGRGGQLEDAAFAAIGRPERPLDQRHPEPLLDQGTPCGDQRRDQPVVVGLVGRQPQVQPSLGERHRLDRRMRHDDH
ncbi:MAG: hypothetical protein ACK55I_14340, partial [bacterium]